MNNCRLNIIYNDFDDSAIMIIESDKEISQENIDTYSNLKNIGVNFKLKSVAIKSLINEVDFAIAWNKFVEKFQDEFESIRYKSLENIFNKLIEKFKIYYDLFSLSKFDLRKFMGLYGELYFINENYRKYGTLVIENWGQPGTQRIDFNFNNEIFEIKSIGESSKQIKISSSSQLNLVTGKELYLIVYRLKVDRGRNTCFEEIIGSIERQLLSNESDLNKFNRILKEIGLSVKEDFYGIPYNFNLVESKCYFINDKFPQLEITDGYIVNDIGIKLDLLTQFEIE